MDFDTFLSFESKVELERPFRTQNKECAFNLISAHDSRLLFFHQLKEEEVVILDKATFHV